MEEEGEAFKRAWAFFAADLRAEARLYPGEAPAASGERGQVGGLVGGGDVGTWAVQ